MTSELEAIATIEDWSEVYELAESYRQQQQWQAVAIALQRSLELKPDFFWSYHHLGDALCQLKQWQNAAKAYTQAIKLDPQFFWSWHNLGDVFSKLQQWQNAAKAYTQAVKLDPQFFWSWHNLGDVFSKLQRWEQAVACYLQGICLSPEHQSYRKLGTALKQRGLEETIEHYRRVMQTPPQNSVFEQLQTEPERLIALADSLTQHHQNYGAIVVCYMMLEIQPTNTDILLHLSRLLQAQNKLETTIAVNQQQLKFSHSSLLNQTVKTPANKTLPKSGRIAIENRGIVSACQINNLCISVGWASRPLNKLEQALNTSFEYVTAWHIDGTQKELIGFARAVSDGVYQATLLDITVHPDFQGRGIGKAIVKTIIKQLHAAQIAEIALFASPHVTDFYHLLGFVSQPHDLEWMLWCPPQKK